MCRINKKVTKVPTVGDISEHKDKEYEGITRNLPVLHPPKSRNKMTGEGKLGLYSIIKESIIVISDDQEILYHVEEEPSTQDSNSKVGKNCQSTRGQLGKGFGSVDISKKVMSRDALIE